MNSMPLRIDGALIKEAKASGQVFHRSIPEQIEHWASLGRALEKVLTVSSVGRVKSRHRPIDLDQALAEARSAAGKKKTLALLARKKGPLYGIKPKLPGLLRQYQPDGKVIADEPSKGKIAVHRKMGKAKAGR